MKGKYFKRGTTSFKVLFTTFVFAFIFVCLFSPFMLIEGANRTLGFVLFGILIFVYLFTIFLLFWDWFKKRYAGRIKIDNPTDEEKNEKIDDK